MALIADGQQAIVDDVRAAIPRGIDPTAGQIGGLDALSIQDRVDALGLEDEARSANEAVWTGHVNARLDQVGLSSALRWAAAAGGHWQLMHEASATYRVVGGMSGFAAAIAADVAGEIRLGAAVTRVAQGAGGAVVTCAGGGRGAGPAGYLDAAGQRDRGHRVGAGAAGRLAAGERRDCRVAGRQGLGQGTWPGAAVLRVREPVASDLAC